MVVCVGGHSTGEALSVLVGLALPEGNANMVSSVLTPSLPQTRACVLYLCAPTCIHLCLHTFNPNISKLHKQLTKQRPILISDEALSPLSISICFLFWYYPCCSWCMSLNTVSQQRFLPINCWGRVSALYLYVCPRFHRKTVLNSWANFSCQTVFFIAVP